MSTLVDATSRVFVNSHESEQAMQVLSRLEGPAGRLSVDNAGSSSELLPTELGEILQQVLQCMARGGTITISETPRELTTSAAAAMLGVSRPTLMKAAREGRIPSHPVGSHTRFYTSDIMAILKAEREEQRVAIADLRDIEFGVDEEI